MKSYLIIAPLLFSVTAYAQDPPCPANVSSLITGQPWAFQLHTGATNPPMAPAPTWPTHGEGLLLDDARLQIPGAAAIGTFVANSNGSIAGQTTTSVNGTISRQQSFSGKHILYPDCSGGEILISVSGFSVQLEFVWSNNFSQMLFTSDSYNIRNVGQDIALTGNARKAPNGCPAGLSNPVQLINGQWWSYRLSGTYFYAPGNASVGKFRPFASGNSGFLSATETSNAVPGAITRLNPQSGRYQIYDNCSGGEIMLMNRKPGAVQLEFVFSSPDYSEMFLLNDNAGNPADVSLGGQAFRH